MQALYAPESSEQANVAGLIDETKLNVAVVEDVAAGGLAVIVVSGAFGGLREGRGRADEPGEHKKQDEFRQGAPQSGTWHAQGA